MADDASSLNKFKADFTGLYNADLPHAYYRKMDQLEYQIPENAKPIINSLIAAIKLRHSEPVSVLDLGCSYGVLSSLVRFDLSLRTLYDRYRKSTSTDASLQREADWYAMQTARSDVRFYGIDISANAIEFATRVGLLDAGVAVNLEDRRNTGSTLAGLPRHIDLIVSTGCVGYIINRTFDTVLSYLDLGSPPIIASFVLRAFDYSEIAQTLTNHGFRTTKLADTTFIQRKFQDSVEQSQIVSLLSSTRQDSPTPKPAEHDGYYHAELFVSVHEDANVSIVDELGQMQWEELK